MGTVIVLRRNSVQKTADTLTFMELCSNQTLVIWLTLSRIEKTTCALFVKLNEHTTSLPLKISSLIPSSMKLEKTMPEKKKKAYVIQKLLLSTSGSACLNDSTSNNQSIFMILRMVTTPSVKSDHYILAQNNYSLYLKNTTYNLALSPMHNFILKLK